MGERIAKIESAFLGYEDHGILTAMLQVSYGGSSQGIGGFSLDGRGKPHRTGTAYGMEWIIRCLRACGVDSWEKVKGRTVLVYFDTDEWGAQPTGFGPLPTEPGEPFMFADIKHLADA